ncbi:MAG: hypothetical protein ACREMB_19920 [Candidatus Rokuibacteriota bacterium]
MRLISDTRDDELSCTECFDLISRYVDLEAGGGDAAASMPVLAQHLRQCGVCHEEYDVLRDLARADTDGVPPVDGPPDSLS